MVGRDNELCGRGLCTCEKQIVHNLTLPAEVGAGVVRIPGKSRSFIGQNGRNGAARAVVVGAATGFTVEVAMVCDQLAVQVASKTRPGRTKALLTNANQLKGLTIRATDGDLGIVDQFYFDDEIWAIRYLTVDTGGWLTGRQVLVSPFSILNVDWPARRLDVTLTKKQVENSPDIDTHQPVSRQHEAAYLGYYGYPFYWGGPYLWGASYSPIGFVAPTAVSAETLANTAQRESADSHLRSNEAVTGYSIEATDGEIGHVAGFVVDDEGWAIRYIEVATRNWWPGKKVLVSPEWIERVSWANSKVSVALSRDAIKNAPEYAETSPITREYENRLYFHYGRPPYWLREAVHASPSAQTGV